MDMYQKRKMRKNKKMNEDTKKCHQRVSIGIQDIWLRPKDS